MAWQVVSSQELKLNRCSVLEAAKEGDLRRIKQDLEKTPIAVRPEINCRDKDDLTPLHNATVWNNFEVVEYLLRNGAIVDSRDKKNLTPLHHSALHGRLEIMKLLLHSGADKDAKCNLDMTPLHYGVKWGYFEIVKHLVDCGANVDIKNSNGETPLDLSYVDELTKILTSKIQKQNEYLMVPDQELLMNIARQMSDTFNNALNDNDDDSDIEVLDPPPDETRVGIKRKIDTTTSKDNEIEAIPGSSNSHDYSNSKRLRKDENNIESTTPSTNQSQGILQELRQEIANLKERLTESSKKINQSRKAICQYCLRVPDGSSYTLNCGHLPFCDQCSKSIIEDVSHAKRICPMCKAPVHMRIQVFTEAMQYRSSGKENEVNVVVL